MNKHSDHEELVAALEAVQACINNLYATKDKRVIQALEAANPALDFGYIARALAIARS